MAPPLRVSRTLLKYALLQIPSMALLITVLLAIDHWWPLPEWVFWGVILVWIAKDVLLYPLVRNAYAPHDPADPMIGAQGVARDRLDPAGYILVRGELWRAEATGEGEPVEPGSPVRVRGMRGLTLLVEAVDEPRETP